MYIVIYMGVKMTKKEKLKVLFNNMLSNELNDYTPDVYYEYSYYKERKVSLLYKTLIYIIDNNIIKICFDYWNRVYIVTLYYNYNYYSYNNNNNYKVSKIKNKQAFSYKFYNTSYENSLSLKQLFDKYN